MYRGQVKGCYTTSCCTLNAFVLLSCTCFYLLTLADVTTDHICPSSDIQQYSNIYQSSHTLFYLFDRRNLCYGWWATYEWLIDLNKVNWKPTLQQRFIHSWHQVTANSQNDWKTLVTRNVELWNVFMCICLVLCNFDLMITSI